MGKIEVKLRRSAKPESKTAAFADVVLELPEGKIELHGFHVFRPNGKPAWVAPAASKGEKKFFPHYSLGGELRKRVEAAILAEFEKQASAAR
ncbi:MAG TPA: hypothetical protein VEJ46_11265 [Candidatus Acidoferrum sp.]|nr:hypothetical protein [Candidatus Acidoferrum sp.]